MIGNGHFATLINPQFAHYNVVDGRRDFAPRVHIATFMQVKHCNARWDDLEILATELALHAKLLAHCPFAFPLSVLCADGRVVRHLAQVEK